MGKKRTKLKQQEKTVLKLMACLYGAILLGICIFLRLLIFFIPDMQGALDKLHIPVVKNYHNVLILEVNADCVCVYMDGERHIFARHDDMESYMDKEFIADIKIINGKVKEIHRKEQVINGKVVRLDGNSVEIEGYGMIPLSPDYKGYRLYGELQMCQAQDLKFGYSFADFCMENGEICGILLMREEVMDQIRVLLKQEQTGGLYHEWATMTSDMNYQVIRDGTLWKTGCGMEEISVEEVLDFQRIQVIPDTLSARIQVKSESAPEGRWYRGTMEFFKTEEGLVIVNELPLEEYLYSVVPSEMPSGYPHNALKAQAICARTYAYIHMLRAGYPNFGAHVDDSTSFQVYNHIQEQESTTNAVKDTYGEILFTNGNVPASTFYYSTSCGVGADPNVWKTNEAASIDYIPSGVLNDTRDLNRVDNNLFATEEQFREFIFSPNPFDFEAGEPWYRWTYEVGKIDVKEVYRRLCLRYDANPDLVLTWNKRKGEYESKELKEFDAITSLFIEKRGAGGYVDEIVIETNAGKMKIVSEHNIRYILSNGQSKVVLQDGKEVDSKNLLPSGFFVMEPTYHKNRLVSYRLIGGGFGHGVGMSQNGAKNMALLGYTASDILMFFYKNCTIKNLYNP